MKILFYINTICRGGAERVVCNLATQFSEHGYECILATSFRNGWEYSIGEKVKRITLFESQLNCGFLRRNISLVRKLKKILKSEKPDVVLSFMAEPNFRTLIAARGLKVKTIVSVRNDPNREYPNFIFRFLAKHLYKKADGVVFQTEEAKKWFPKLIQKKSKIIFNQVDEVFYNTIYNGKRHDIVTTGRLTTQKNHKMLIRAFAAIADKISDNLIIYGEGELRGELEAIIAELHMEKRVFLPGSVKNVADTIKSAKLFVLSSDYEGMPNALMEAMALGIPCISTDCPCGGPRMLFGDELKDLLIPTGNQDVLGEKMLSALRTNLFHFEKIKHRALFFEPKQIMHSWEKYLDAVVREKKKND